jgi:hypothetical protein
MSITYTYASLVAAIKSFAEEPDVDFSNNIDDFIAKAETRLLRDLDLELFEAWQTVTVSGGNRVVAKPADTIEINDLWVRSPADLKWVECPRRSFEYCFMYSPTESVTGRPTYYSEFDELNFYVVPTPDQSYSGGNARVRATIRPSGLSASNQNTWLGDNVADMLFAACMVEAYDYQKNPTKLQESASKYQSLTPGVAREMDQIQRKAYKSLSTAKKGADD